MKVLGYPTEWDAQQGLVPLGLSDVQLNGTAEEYEALSAFFREYAENLRSGSKLSASHTLGNDDPAATTGVSFMAFPH